MEKQDFLLVLVAMLFGFGIGWVAGYRIASVVDDGDATRERCVQDCAGWAKKTTDDLREFCSEEGRKCESLAERTDPTKFKPLYRPGNIARHASCQCSDGGVRMTSIWSGDEVW